MKKIIMELTREEFNRKEIEKSHIEKREEALEKLTIENDKKRGRRLSNQ